MQKSLDLFRIVPAIVPVVVADNTATTPVTVDKRGYTGVTFAIVTGTLADVNATFAVLVEDSPDDSNWTAAADAVLLTQTSGTAPETAASFTFADDNEVRKIDYVGLQPYVRITITPSGNSGDAPLAAVAILRGGNAPVATYT